MKPYLKYGLITCCILIIWTMIQYLTGLDRSDVGQYLNWISYPIMIVFIVLTLNEVKSQNEGYLSFGDGFKNGFLMMVVVAAIMSVFTFIYFSFINPEFLDYVREKAIEEMENKDMSDEEIEQAMGIAEIFMGKGAMAAFALFGNMVVGAILSLIIAAIMKKEKQVIQ